MDVLWLSRTMIALYASMLRLSNAGILLCVLSVDKVHFSQRELTRVDVKLSRTAGTLSARILGYAARSDGTGILCTAEEAERRSSEELASGLLTVMLHIVTVSVFGSQSV